MILSSCIYCCCQSQASFQFIIAITMATASFAECLLWVFSLYFYVFLLNVIVPGTLTVGYALDSKGKALRYYLNGLRVLLLSVATFLG